MGQIEMVSTYFMRRLAKLGYEDVKTQWSLNYCQGDGMAFYGNLYSESIKRLAERLLKSAERAAMKRVADKGWTLEIEGISSHYHHWNTMRIHVNYGETLTPFELTVLASFFFLVNEDVKDVSRQLASEGYKILQACCPRWWWKHEGIGLDKPWGTIQIDLPALPGKLKAVAYLEECESYNPYDWGNGDDDHEEVASLAKGENGVCDVRLEILDEENVIGSGQLAEVADTLDGAYVRKVIEECLEDAKAEAQKYIDSVKRRFKEVTL